MTRKILLQIFLILITISHTSTIYAQRIKEREMVAYVPKTTQDYQKAKTFAAFADFGASFFMRQNPYSDLSDCDASIDLDVSYGYFFNSYFYVGPGVGIRAYSKKHFTAFPVFGELRGYWKRAFIYARGGYGFISGNNDTGGVCGAIGLGFNIISKTKYKLFLNMSYEFQDHKRNDTHVTRTEVLTGKNGVAVRIGTQF